jgi:hypothetical protein
LKGPPSLSCSSHRVLNLIIIPLFSRLAANLARTKGLKFGGKDALANGVIRMIHVDAQPAKFRFHLQDCKLVAPLLGDRKGQGWAVPAAVATEVSGEVGRGVHDNLSGAGR